ncbi:hypothetical protein [Mucilaginibacter auburnensis]|nr:hypothetical protein [Mucilaginibacter auburnensis]
MYRFERHNLFFLTFLAIPIIILGGGDIIGGFVLGLLADQVFK